MSKPHPSCVAPLKPLKISQGSNPGTSQASQQCKRSPAQGPYPRQLRVGGCKVKTLIPKNVMPVHKGVTAQPPPPTPCMGHWSKVHAHPPMTVQCREGVAAGGKGTGGGQEEPTDGVPNGIATKAKGTGTKAKDEHQKVCVLQDFSLKLPF